MWLKKDDIGVKEVKTMESELGIAPAYRFEAGFYIMRSFRVGVEEADVDERIKLETELSLSEIQNKLEELIFSRFSEYGEKMQFRGVPIVVVTSPKILEGHPILFVHPKDRALAAEFTFRVLGAIQE